MPPCSSQALYKYFFIKRLFGCLKLRLVDHQPSIVNGCAMCIFAALQSKGFQILIYICLPFQSHVSHQWTDWIDALCVFHKHRYSSPSITIFNYFGANFFALLKLYSLILEKNHKCSIGVWRILYMAIQNSITSAVNIWRRKNTTETFREKLLTLLFDFLMNKLFSQN